MEITAKTKILALIREYPFLLDFLAGRHVEFEKLKSPILRNTLGRVATVEMAANMAKMPVEALLAAVRAEVAARTGGAAVQPAPQTTEEKLGALKEILKDLHAGADPAALKERFAQVAGDVDPTEISNLEQQLLTEGLPQEEVKRLCDVHVEIFKDSLEKDAVVQAPPGHPVHTFMEENRAVGENAEFLQGLLDALGEPPAAKAFEEMKAMMGKILDRVAQVEIHYTRKENQLFPYLEKRGVSGPSQVMWGIHDDVRGLLKAVRNAFGKADLSALRERGKDLVRAVLEMIYKENKILFPMALELLDEGAWGEIRAGEDEIGYALVRPAAPWAPDAGAAPPPAPDTPASADRLLLDTGALSAEQVNLLLTHLPVDITFIDEKDEVRYFSRGKERVFPRSPGIIGRTVQNCHPPKSVHMVNRILEAFKAGTKDEAGFWISFRDRFLHIRYFAVRDGQGAYRGTLEVTQDATDVRALQGERRLLDWE